MAKLSPVGNPFLDQCNFMTACDQTVGTQNQKQYAMYLKLIDEEVGELHQSPRTFVNERVWLHVRIEQWESWNLSYLS